jgi:Glycosyltransferase like family
MNDETSFATESSLSFVACVSDDELLQSNLLTSPCLRRGSRHEVILVRGCKSAAKGLNLGIERAAGEWIVCVHQDVFLPGGWDLQLARQLQEADLRFGPIGVAGVYGVGPAIRQDGCLAAERVGCVVDRGRELHEAGELPARANTLDESLLVVPEDTPLRFDPELGFHLYGADLCLQAAERGLAVVAIEAPCEHNSRSIGLPPEFFKSAEVFARKWQHRLPVATPCVVIDETRRVWLLGNSASDYGGKVEAGATILTTEIREAGG